MLFSMVFESTWKLVSVCTLLQWGTIREGFHTLTCHIFSVMLCVMWLAEYLLVVQEWLSSMEFISIPGCWWVLSPTRKETSYSDRRFWFSYSLFIIIIGRILVVQIYIIRLASNEILSPSNKIHREVGRAKDLPVLCLGLLGFLSLSTP
jgi:cellobiose-specific phosphotransferase system component IIC